ncbi:hypothetical protein LDO26_01255 [Luteimonas sp. BDR2-5]|uniref:hypothetical protein n=1 Tax=Proluteimonas luteida TaxID=2878685 RepID=UPI001E5D1276|nr:hypothetical protein [Luteimonas sp. BDR2-5]MCD9026844.1 hypothetical protein [Luteimonas sp. BDR2-5]
MSSAQLYATPLHLYAMAPGGEVIRLPAGDTGEGTDPALSEAAAWLRSKTTFGARVDLLLASSLVRFATVPWIAGACTGGALRRQVQRHLGERHGDDLAEWTLRIQWPRYGWPTFAIGYPTRQLSAVSAALLDAGLSIDRTMATAVAVVARHGGKMPGGAALIGFEENDGLTGVHLSDGAISEVERLPGVGRGLDAPDVWCNRKRFEFPASGQLRWLQSAHGPAAFRALALTAASSGSACAATDLLMAIR